ncbi:unnamed protein product [Amoebophrya sp. A25]|nr:unnamed protein product [Amoebophrya sp. A25]|eukprot:GSA25T00018448001.1
MEEPFNFVSNPSREDMLRSILPSPTTYPNLKSLRAAYELATTLSWREEGFVYRNGNLRCKIRNPKFVALRNRNYRCRKGALWVGTDPDWVSIITRFAGFAPLVRRTRDQLDFLARGGKLPENFRRLCLLAQKHDTDATQAIDKTSAVGYGGPSSGMNFREEMPAVERLLRKYCDAS